MTRIADLTGSRGLARGVKSHSPVTEVRLYGSRAKGNFRQSSEIDLSIMDEAVTDADLLIIENDIDDLLLPYSVDLCLFRQIDNPALTEHILRNGKVLYAANA
ncbi:nucleotidyltransferase domain-containing protein [Massilia sp. TWR1-2-2]|uniref:nucleotidyltransferase domain-containing protein n=1 Tax=Massilia sp. TWR1-2-2 TaxID=2804584 RepID=UPI003CF21AF2